MHNRRAFRTNATLSRLRWVWFCPLTAPEILILIKLCTILDSFSAICKYTKAITWAQSTSQRAISWAAGSNALQHVDSFDEGLIRWLILHAFLTFSNHEKPSNSGCFQDYYQGDNNYQRGAPLPAHYRHSQTDLTVWDENQPSPNGNHQNGHSRDYPQQQATRRSMISNGGSQDRYPEERRDLYQYRNGNVSREDFGEQMDDRRREGRRDNNVISNAVLNHLAGLHRRPVNRVSFAAFDRASSLIISLILLEFKLAISCAVPGEGARLRITRSCWACGALSNRWAGGNDVNNDRRSPHATLFI